MFNLPVRKSEINVVLSAVLASMLLLSISSLPYTISKPIAITNYANAQTSSTVENASGIELSDTTINATTNGSMTQMTNQDNRSSNTQNKTELKDVAPFVFEDSNQQTNQSNVTGASVAGSDSAVTGSSEVTADFNGDGFEDKAIGVPYEDVDSADGTIIDAGIVHVIYGSAGGLSTSAVLSDQLITQDSLDFIIPMRSEIGD
ncbi:MAG TPA: FG-GAP repeat protein, partial [Nitrososphaeraceae archaeon]|nr:FG-GAP repeat protein [Nitrososphaeraceae archaeon]